MYVCAVCLCIYVRECECGFVHQNQFSVHMDKRGYFAKCVFIGCINVCVCVCVCVCCVVVCISKITVHMEKRGYFAKCAL